MDRALCLAILDVRDVLKDAHVRNISGRVAGGGDARICAWGGGIYALGGGCLILFCAWGGGA